jgi:cellulose synthase/poly-beta-1,6-N-acetylglucosamine synthase-like glycosyltransferase
VTVIVFAALCGACLILVIYPYLLYPIILRRMSRNPARPHAVDLSASLIFCAHNEAETLPEKLENLRVLKASMPSLEILAYDDASTDDTASILASEPDLLRVVRGTRQAGKMAGMNVLANLASGDVLVLTDANVMFAPDAVHRLLAYYGDESVGGVCGTLHYDAGHSATAEVGSTYWSLDEKLRTLESDTGNVMGADGSIFSVRRNLFPELPPTAQDDFAVSMSVIFAGARLVKAPDAIAFERSVSKRDDELRRKVRIATGAYFTHKLLRDRIWQMPRRDRFKYMSRKMTRWFGGLFLALAGLFGLAAVASISVSVAVALLIAGLALLSITLISRRGPLAKVGEALLAIYATLYGVLQGMFGRSVATWSPAKSR